MNIDHSGDWISHYKRLQRHNATSVQDQLTKIIKDFSDGESQIFKDYMVVQFINHNIAHFVNGWARLPAKHVTEYVYINSGIQFLSVDELVNYDQTERMCLAFIEMCSRILSSDDIKFIEGQIKIDTPKIRKEINRLKLLSK